MSYLVLTSANITLLLLPSGQWGNRYNRNLCEITPSSEDYTRLFENLRGSKTAYEWFYDSVVSSVVGKQYWNKHCHESPGCIMANNGAEALALLLLDNSWDLWRKKAESSQMLRNTGVGHIDDIQDESDNEPAIHDDQSESIDVPAVAEVGVPEDGYARGEESLPLPKMLKNNRTHSRGKGRNYGTKYTTATGGFRLLGGWTVEGINKFTYYKHLVAKDREDRGFLFDKWYMARKLKLRMGKVRRLKGGVVDQGINFPDHDWSDDEQDVQGESGSELLPPQEDSS